MKSNAIALVMAIAVTLGTGAVQAVEIKVISTTALKSLLGAVKPEYEQATGNQLAISYDASTLIKDRVAAGEPFDAIFLTSFVMDDMIRAAKVEANTSIEIGRSGDGIAYAANAAAPDLHDSQSFKDAISKARSIAYTTQGPSGTHFLSVCDHLGIRNAVDAKSKILPASESVGEAIPKGEAELAVQLISELLPVKGIRVVPFPPDLQEYISLYGAVGSSAIQPKAAASLLRFLADGKRAALMRSIGFQQH